MDDAMGAGQLPYIAMENPIGSPAAHAEGGDGEGRLVLTSYNGRR